jgi:4-alpha-glucanotransferase
MAFRRFDVNRLDHFIGFIRTYEVPAEAKTAVIGKYQAGGGASFFEAVRKTLGPVSFIGDDLGAITSEVVALLDQFQIPGTRVLQFEFGSRLENSPPSEPRPKASVVYTGTHDNDTTKGWYEKLPNTQREALQKQLIVNDREIVWAMIREAQSSPADTVIIPAQDLLDLGSEARMNVPGRAKGSWQWRLKEGALTRVLAQRLRSESIKWRRFEKRDFAPVPPRQKNELTLQIAKRAYELYERQGRQAGQTVQNWLLAEQQVAMEAKK